MMYDAACERVEVGFSRQYMRIDTWMVCCCFCSCVHFFVPRNAVVARGPHERNCTCAVVECCEESDDLCN